MPGLLPDTWRAMYGFWYRGEGKPSRGVPDIFPAIAGTSVLDLVVEPGEADEPDKHEVFASPVIGWLYSAAGVRPITARGLDDGAVGGDLTIEFPTGQVVATSVGRWSSRRAWLEGVIGRSEDGPTSADLNPIQ